MCIRDRYGEIIGTPGSFEDNTHEYLNAFDGNFALSVSPKATIIISYVGYATQEVPVSYSRTVTHLLLSIISIQELLLMNLYF